MTILPKKSSFLSGLAGGASEGMLYNVQNKLEQQSYQKAVQGFKDYFQGVGGISGATQENPMAVFGEPSQTTGGGLQGMGGQPQNPIMRAMLALGRSVGGMGRDIQGGIQGLLSMLGGRGAQQRQQAPQQSLRSPQVSPMAMNAPGAMNTPGAMMGPQVTGQGMDPRVMAIIQSLMGGRMGMF